MKARNIFFLDLDLNRRVHLAQRFQYVFGQKNIGCPTRYRTRHFFNNSNTNEDIATKFEQGGFNPIWKQMVATSITCYDVVAISSLVVKLLKKCRFR
jgi:predicted PhzF superfamily epimerase YddE/YHI9